MDWPGTPQSAQQWPGTLQKQAWPGTPKPVDNSAGLAKAASIPSPSFDAKPAPNLAVNQNPPIGDTFKPQSLTDYARDKSKPMVGRVAAAIPLEIGNVASGVMDALKLPGDVAQGKVDPMSPEAIGRSTNLAGLVSGETPRITGKMEEAKPAAVRPTVADIPKAQDWPGQPVVKAAGVREWPGRPVETANENQPKIGAKMEEAPQSLSAGKAPTVELPAKPAKGFIGEQSDDLFRHDQTGDADKIEMTKFAKALPPEVVEMKEKFFNYLEPGAKPELTPAEQAAFDKYLKPLVQEQRDLTEEIRKLAPDVLPNDFDPDYVHHMVKGKVPEFDQPLGLGEASEHLPYQMSKLPQTTRSLQRSRYYALDDGRGGRQVAMLDDKGNLYLMKDGKPVNVPAKDIKLPPNSTDIQPGATIRIGDKEMTLKRASVAEKEQATPHRYYKDAFASTIGNVVRLRKVARAVSWFNNLKSSPEWTAYARSVGGNRPLPEGYREPRMPLFKGWAVDSHLADLLDDYYGQRGPIEEKLSRMNQAVVGTLFWQPVTHAVNVATHWTVGRGWDWLNVPQWAGYARDMASAVKDVAQQGPITQALLKEGSAQVLPRVVNRDFYSNVLKALGEDVRKNPKQYDSMLKTLGMKPAAFYKMWMDSANKALWYANDVFMTHRVLELKRKGLSTSQAIAEAEKHIPNYRIPPRVMGSRVISRFMSSPAASEFGRFHYNVWNSYAHMARDLVKGSGKEKVDALGHVMALGVLGMLVWPAISAGIAKLTGRPTDRAAPRGPLGVAQDARDIATMLAPQTTAKIGMSPSERSFSQILQSVVSLSPVVDEAVTQATGRQAYTGQPVTTPGERAQSVAGRVSPVQILTDLWSGKFSPGQEALKSTIGVQRARPPVPPQVLKQTLRQQAKSAGQQPVDSFITWLGGKLGQAGIRP